MARCLPMDTDSPDDLLGISEAAEVAHASVTSVRRWADSGALPHVRTPGGQRRFRRADVEALLTPEQAS